MEFYAELYTSEYREEQLLSEQFLNNLPQVSQQDNSDLESPLTLQELQAALMSMENGKSPGIDGLPVDFYKSFWSTIGEDLLEVLRNSFLGGKLPLGCRRAVITLLPKKGDLCEIKNWRPVSLLCADYKILSKVLANRLKNVMEQVVHVDQSYCIPGRSIRDNISLIRDYLEISGSLNLKFGLVSLDQQKAFDRVEHQYLWKTLEAFGFSSVFVRMIRTLYVDIESVLKVNGGLSAPFSIKRGIRQGCALSGMLYSLACEPLLCKIRRDLKGVKIRDDMAPLHLSAYADDIIVAVADDSDVQKLMQITESYGKISSSKVNWEKSTALLVGQWQGNVPRLPDRLTWGRRGIKYLGIYLGDQTEGMKNWEGEIEKWEGRLKKWQWLLPRMSFRGRTLIINNLVASTLWHRLTVVEPPPGLLVKLQRLIVDFFWDRLHWVPQSVLFLPKEEGGQGLVHLESRKTAFRLQVAQNFMYGAQNIPWRKVAECFFGKLGNLGFGRTVFMLDYSGMDLNCLSPFYNSVLKAWRLMEKRTRSSNPSLYWLLKEPVFQGARCGAMVEAPLRTLMDKGITTVQHVVELAGVQMDNAEAVARRMEVRSVRIVARMLEKFKMAFTHEDRAVLAEWSNGQKTAEETDLFPSVHIKPHLRDCHGLGPLLGEDSQDWMPMDSVSGKALYQGCVKVLNKHQLKNRTDTPWRGHFKVHTDIKPEWSKLYKPPLTKNTGDLQWRILHGIVAVNAFVAVLNPEVSNVCPFCTERETIYHCFAQCQRLISLFRTMSALLLLFGEVFTKQMFIFGFKYGKGCKKKGALLNFLFGQAKLAIYLSRKEKVDGGQRCDCLLAFKNLVKARIRFEYKYYEKMEDMDEFKKTWDCEGAMWSVNELGLTFVNELL